MARVAALGLSVAVTHLKSSAGAGSNEDAANAEKRETTTAALAAWVVTTRQNRPADTVLVGGDFNVGERDSAKNGTNLSVECFAGGGCGGTDRYDETHALLESGLVQGLTMTSLSQTLDRSYAAVDFGVGPIDVLYVVGPAVSRFQTAQRSTSSFGSDHFAVWTRLTTGGIQQVDGFE